MIVVLSLNTAVDRTFMVPRFRLGEEYRPRRVVVDAGGKGLNVARVLRQLGHEVRVVGFLGGSVAPFVERWCADMDIESHWIPIQGETRTCVVVADPDAGEQTVLNETGPQVTGEEVQGVEEALQEVLVAGDLLCISGSAPPGVPTDFFARIVRAFPDVRTLVDSSGDHLRRAIEARPWGLAPNLAEAATLGLPSEPTDALDVLRQHVSIVLLTMGADGVGAALSDGRVMVPAPQIEVVNAIGSGDALVAGFLAGVEEGLSDLAALRLGVACATANAIRLEQGIGSRSRVDLFLERILAV